MLTSSKSYIRTYISLPTTPQPYDVNGMSYISNIVSSEAVLNNISIKIPPEPADLTLYPRPFTLAPSYLTIPVESTLKLRLSHLRKGPIEAHRLCFAPFLPIKVQF